MSVPTDARDEPGEGLFQRRAALRLPRRLRVRIGVVPAVAAQSSWRLLDAELVDGRKMSREELVERIVRGLAAFDIRWKGHGSPRPEKLPPAMRTVGEEKPS